MERMLKSLGNLVLTAAFLQSATPLVWAASNADADAEIVKEPRPWVAIRGVYGGSPEPDL